MITQRVRYIGLLIFCLSISCLIGCHSTDEVKSQLQSYDWLEGNWKMTDANDIFMESWKWADDRLEGVAFKLETNGDTLVNEKMTIQMDDTIIEFVADVKHNSEPIHFKGKQSEIGFRFENPGHDFPKWLIYERQGNDSMFATIGDDSRKMKFSFIRVRD